MKIKYITMLLSAASVLSGCSVKENPKVNIYHNDLSLTAPIEHTDTTRINEMIEDKENFILVSYALYSCSCWSNFRDYVLIPYVEATNLPIHVIHADLLPKGYFGLPINSKKNNTPVIGVFGEGEIKHKIHYKENSQVFQNLGEFENWLHDKIIRPVLTFINLEQLKTLLKGNKPFILDWYLSICPDCLVYETRLLKPYVKALKDSPRLPYYVIETTPYRSDKDAWNTMKNVYGLSDIMNKESGYGLGFVPTIQVINPDGTDYVTTGDVSPIISDAIVFQNEKVAKIDNKFIITDSYFNGVRGKKYIGEYESEIGKEVDASLVNHNDIATSFIAGSRYDINAQYTTLFLDHYFK